MSARSFASRIRGLFVENIGLKLLAFAFALILYALTHGARDAQRSFVVDVVANLPPENAGRVLMTQLPELRITAAGSRSLLDDLKAEDFGSLELDLRSGDIQHVDLDPSMIRTPLGVQITHIDPTSVSLEWEDEISRTIPIQAAVAGEPAPGFVVVGTPIIEPKTVGARGPKSLVEPIQFARADAFDVSGLDQEASFTRTLAIDRPPSRVSFDARTIVARVEIERETLSRHFIKVPIEVVGKAGAVVSPREVDVEIEGPPDIVNRLRADQIVPIVDLKTENLSAPGSIALPVTVEIEECTARIIPHRVTVRWR